METILTDAEVTLNAKSFKYDKQTGTYLIKLSDAVLISHNNIDETLTFTIKEEKVHKNSQTTQINDLSAILDDDQMEYLLDEIEMENDQQIRSHSHHNSDELNHHTILSDIMSEWNLNFNNTKKSDISHTQCNGNTLCKDCKSCKRIKFIMHYYSEWIHLKSLSQTKDEDMPSPSILSTPSPSKAAKTTETKPRKETKGTTPGSTKEIMSTFEWISDFFYELTNYSTYDLCNDFQHILEYHIRTGLKDKLETMTYFELELGECCDLNCQCYKRHKRDINIDNMMENKRKEIFFIISDELQKQKVSEFKVNTEINLQNTLDCIHVCLLHQKHKMFISNSFKYITRMNQRINGKKVEKENDNEEIKDIKLEKYTFGSSITYWDPKHHRYCKPKYSDLRHELLRNTVYPLSSEMYESLKSKAIHFLNTKSGKSLIAQREHDWMKKFRILRGSQISLDHVIALYCYCNIPCLQRAYKRYGYQRDGKTRDELLRKHCEIWHFSRLLLEAVHCYGMPLDKNKKYYHGIDCKLIFDRYNVMIDMPLSLTTEKDIGYSFSDVSGITVEFGHGGLSDLQSLCLDLSFFSDFPLEEEYLIFHSFVGIRDIIQKRLHHDQWVSILRFWHKLTEGFFFQHVIQNNIISRNDQLCICAMVQNNMLTTKSKKYDHRIPNYMQKLFDVLGQNGVFWVIQSEYDLLVPKLKKLLISSSSPYIEYLQSKDVSIRFAQTFNWKINAINTNKLFLNNHPWIKSEQYKVFINDKKHHLLFHFEINNKPKSNLFRCRIHLDEKPKYVSSITFGNGLFCDELKFDNYSYGELTTNRLFNMSLHSLFETNLLKPFAEKGFNLKLQIQIFSIKRKNGDSIIINPHQ